MCFRAAVQSCPEDDEDSLALSSEDRQSSLNIKQSQIRHIVSKYRRTLLKN